MVKMESKIVLSTLPKTWIIDLDGTLVRHNGYKKSGEDELLPRAKEYMDRIPDSDYVLIMTAREEIYMESTIRFLADCGIRYDKILFNIPMGERIVVNDRKPSGIDMAIAINTDRNNFGIPEIVREL